MVALYNYLEPRPHVVFHQFPQLQLQLLAAFWTALKASCMSHVQGISLSTMTVFSHPSSTRYLNRQQSYRVLQELLYRVIRTLQCLAHVLENSTSLTISVTDRVYTLGSLTRPHLAKVVVVFMILLILL